MTYSSAERRERQLLEKGLRHWEEGHLNRYVRDEQSYRTSYGRHARVTVLWPNHGKMFARVDMVHGLREPTTEEVLRVAAHDIPLTGRWECVSVTPFTAYDIDCFEWTFVQN